MACNTIQFSAHGVVKMILRDIEVESAMFVVRNGMILSEYPNDKPFPSRLVLGWINIEKELRPLHVVVAENNNNHCIIITAYWPDEDIWNNDFKTKK